MDNKHVVVAMSGGVDSSVAAAMLVEEGYQVIGMMLKLWSADCSSSENACCTPESIEQARQVAGLIGIPFYVIDAKDTFKEIVVDNFIKRSLSGLTPNPCYLCNQRIRWGLLFEKARSYGANFFATGHYANVEKGNDGVYHLYRGVDEKKDQSYVLSGLNQEQLSHTILPLGKFKKEQIREKALQIGLPVATKQDSQDLCFIGNEDYRSFLINYAGQKTQPGNIVDKNGKILGVHNGLQNYTIGQRKGLGAGNLEPIYVIAKNPSTNQVIVGQKNDLQFNRIKVEEINWISGQKPQFPLSVGVKIRYKASIRPCEIDDCEPGGQILRLPEPVRDATPGQIAVFYKENEVLGSAEITSAWLEEK